MKLQGKMYNWLWSNYHKLTFLRKNQKMSWKYAQMLPVFVINVLYAVCDLPLHIHASCPQLKSFLSSGAIVALVLLCLVFMTSTILFVYVLSFAFCKSHIFGTVIITFLFIGVSREYICNNYFNPRFLRRAGYNASLNKLQYTPSLAVCSLWESIHCFVYFL